MHRTTLFLLAGFATVILGSCTGSTDPSVLSTLPNPIEPTTSTTATTSTVGSVTTTSAPWEPPEHPVRIVDGGFVDTRSGEPFIVRGTNYLTRVPVGRGYQDRTFSPAVFDPEAVAADFADLEDRGYNTVRIFMDSCNGGPDCIAASDGDGLNGKYLDVIVEVMHLARRYGLLLLLTSNDLPDNAGYWEMSDTDNAGVFPGYRNSHYMTASGEQAAERYWNDLLIGLTERQAPFDVVLGWSILNEQWMFKDQYPLAPGSGIVTTKTGTYYTADPDQARAMVGDGIDSYVTAVAAVIGEHDPHGLVTMGFFAPQFPNESGIGGDWLVDTQPLVEDSTLDFFDFHAYPGEDITLAEIAENFGLPADKPVVMGEVGAFIDRYRDIDQAALAVQQWIAESCDLGWDGWLYWEMLHADLSVGDATWALTAADGLLLDVLAPVSQPDACTPTLTDPNLSRGATVRASRSLGDEPPELAVDGNTATQWGSGADATQWIEIDLGTPKAIGRIRLVVAQWPEGRTVHVVTIDGLEVWTFDGDTSGGDLIEPLLDAPAIGQTIRVTTTMSPSWVAWSEIEVLAP